MQYHIIPSLNKAFEINLLALSLITNLCEFKWSDLQQIRKGKEWRKKKPNAIAKTLQNSNLVHNTNGRFAFINTRFILQDWTSSTTN